MLEGLQTGSSSKSIFMNLLDSTVLSSPEDRLDTDPITGEKTKKIRAKYTTDLGELKKDKDIILQLLEIGYFKDMRKVSKTYNISGFSYEKNDLEFFDNSVVNLLPQEIQEELKENFKEKSNGRDFLNQEELLKFARGTYLQLCLESQLKKESEITIKKLKI